MESSQDFYVQTKESPPEYVFKCVEGKCVFLDDQNLCVMHKEWGFLQKAPNCMQYPFTFTRAPDGIRVGLLFSCEGVALADPQIYPIPLEEAQQIFPVAREIVEIGETVPLTLEKQIPFTDYQFLEKIYFQLLERDPLEDALISYGLLLDDFVKTSKMPQETLIPFYLEKSKKYSGNLRSQRSFVLTMITLLDAMRHGSSSLGFLRLFQNQMKAWFNQGVIPVHDVGQIPMKGLEKIPFPPAEEERLRTFLIQLVWRRRLLPRVSIYRGFRLICIYYSLIRFLARGLTALEGKSEISKEILLQTLDLMERYYISHNKFTDAFDPGSPYSSFFNTLFYNSALIPILVRSHL
mgnify:FL=1